jgi:hypothetical protein
VAHIGYREGKLPASTNTLKPVVYLIEVSMDAMLLVSSFPELGSSDMCGDLICASGEMKTHHPIIATGNLPS